MKCPECGEIISANEGFCPNCGHVFDYSSPSAPSKAKTSGGAEFSDSIETIRRESSSRRRTLLWALMAVVVVAAFALFISNLGQKVHDDSTFPDKALQQYIGEKVDTNGDGKLSDQEILAVKRLDGFEGRGIKSLEGLELFDNLEVIDASNAGVETLFRTYSNQLFSSHDDEGLLKLKVLNLNGNNLAKLSFSDSCRNLEELYCADNQLTYISIDRQDALRVLDCSRNAFTKTLDLSDATALSSVNCSGNQITYLNLPTSVLDLNCADCALEGVHFDAGYSGKSVTLNSLYCQNNQIVSVVSGSGIAWNSVHMASPDNCDLSNNPGIRLAQRSDGNWYVDFDQLNP